MKRLAQTLRIGYESALTGEIILTYDELILLLDYVFQHEYAIVLGGDVLDVNDRHTYLNWYYQPQESITRVENITQSCQAAQRYIRQLTEARSRHYVIVLGEVYKSQRGNAVRRSGDHRSACGNGTGALPGNPPVQMGFAREGL